MDDTKILGGYSCLIVKVTLGERGSLGQGVFFTTVLSFLLIKRKLEEGSPRKPEGSQGMPPLWKEAMDWQGWQS